ncbi:MAG: 3'-5' exoribonuclease domain-containing protein, partial [Cyclobacteriaceae bacterium]
ATLTGTTNQVSVANGNGSITLSTPQDIHTAATPTFDSETLGIMPDAIILNMSMLCGNWDDIFGKESGSKIRNLVGYRGDFERAAAPSLLEFYKEAVVRMKKRTLSINFDEQEQAENGRTLTESVMRFWLDHPEAYENMTSGKKISLDKLGSAFYKYLERTNYDAKKGGTEVLIRAPHFDSPIVRDAMGGIEPYNHFNIRDIRTIVDMAWLNNNGNGYINLVTDDGEQFLDQLGFIKHDAVDDIARDMVQVHLSYCMVGKL